MSAENQSPADGQQPRPKDCRVQALAMPPIYGSSIMIRLRDEGPYLPKVHVVES